MDFKFDLQLPNFLHTTQIPWLFEDLLFKQAVEQSKLVINGEKISVDSTYGHNTKTFYR
jgi:hypothetical protein